MSSRTGCACILSIPRRYPGSRGTQLYHSRSRPLRAPIVCRVQCVPCRVCRVHCVRCPLGPRYTAPTQLARPSAIAFRSIDDLLPRRIPIRFSTTFFCFDFLGCIGVVILSHFATSVTFYSVLILFC